MGDTNQDGKWRKARDMSLFVWTDELSVGIKEFDSHHKRLIQLINLLHDAIATGEDHIAIREVLTELSNYTLYHFFAEEDTLQKYGYPGLPEHRREHLNFTEQTLGFVESLHEGKTGLSLVVLDFLKGWLRHHILETDKAYGPFLNDKGAY